MHARVTIAAGIVVATTCLLLGQNATAPWARDAVPPGLVIGPGNFIHIVEDLDRSLAFYQDILGMDLQRGAILANSTEPLPGSSAGRPPQVILADPPAPPRPFGGQPEIMRLYNAVDTPYRLAAIMVGDWPMRTEQIEFKGDDRKPIRPRIQDPGASMLILTVQNLDVILARVRAARAPVVTTGGAPVTMVEDMRRFRAIMLRDPDGFFVQLREPELGPPIPSTSVSTDGNLMGVSFGMTVSNTENALRVFKALGFEPREATPTGQARLNLMGTPLSTYTRTTMMVPGSSFQYELFEFSGADRQAVHSTTKDPGTPVLRIRVSDIDAALAKLAEVGVNVWSTGGEPVTVAPGINAQRFAITTGVDNVYIQVVQQVRQP